MIRPSRAGLLALLMLALLAGCAGTTVQPSAGICPAPATSAPAAAPVCPVCPVCPAVPLPLPVPPEPPKAETFERANFADLPGWPEDSLSDAYGALRASCSVLRNRNPWREVCAAAMKLEPGALKSDALRAFFESQLAPWRIAGSDGSTQGLVTGYYEPLLRGSRVRTDKYRVPLYAPPDDLITVDLSSVHPELRNLRLRGRIEGRRLVPYWPRADIDRGNAPVAGKELLWVDDRIEAFFLEIQGSGRVQFDSGETVRVGYADQNGHPYMSIGRVLIDRGELKSNEASMQGIQAWGRANPARLQSVLDANPSYVFFRETPVADASAGPAGALGVALTPRRSIAADPRFIPLGAPVFLATTLPLSDQPMQKLMFAQDTGGAIRGAVRADFFWGFGAEAGALAGRMRQSGRMWLLWPKDSAPPRPRP